MMRGINVGGQKIIRMESLRASFRALGFLRVRSYVQSGNIIFEASKGPTSSLSGKIREKILNDFGLSVPPAKAVLKKLDALAPISDRFRVGGREVYLHCPDGYGRTKLSNTAFEKLLSVDATTRNWKTVNTLAELSTR